MAELNISGFVTPEQQYAGLYKLADTLEKQKALSQKAQKSNLSKLELNIDPSKFHTGTIEDANIEKEVYNTLQKGYQFQKDNPGSSQNDLNMYVYPMIAKIATSSQNVIEKKRQIDAGWEELKNNPGADRQKYYIEANKIFQNDDGTTKDATTIDVTRNDDIANIIKNGDIWNNAGFNKIMEDFNKNSKQAKGITIVKTKGKDIVTSVADVEHSDLYEPVQTGTDANGVPIYSDEFRQKGEKSVKLPKIDQSGNVVIDPSTNQPILEDKMIIGDNIWKRLNTDEKTSGWVNGLLKEYALKHNVDKNSDEAINAVKNQMHEMIDASGQKNKMDILFSTKRHFSTPRSSGGAGAGGGQMRDYNQLINDAYDKAIDTYGKNYNVKISDLESDLQTAIIDALKGAGRTKANADKYRLQRDANGILRVYDINTMQDVLPVTDALNTVKQATKEAKVEATKKANKNPTPSTQVKHGVSASPKSKGKGKFDNF